MEMTDIIKIANSMNLQPGLMGKTTLIRFIQKEEGNFDCFAKATRGVCDQKNCIWREDCLALSTKDTR